ncbi:hypothetical protein L226DRAFT_199405 [Lentinus tigrinus ALCF2SS1-7]|uniref:uncharacterized protein n=1 Tax=Lentinus tigrinus ALCF2SS1-7 TaxID=1328758 RepID=UPI001165EEB8|nr:hypothetical protein L226DRAFT_199405 [Lentinus tigrinus ALCF2SS1-7]
MQGEMGGHARVRRGYIVIYRGANQRRANDGSSTVAWRRGHAAGYDTTASFRRPARSLVMGSSKLRILSCPD